MGYMQVQSVCERISCMCMPARRRALLVEPSAPPPNIALLALEDNQSNAKALEPTVAVSQTQSARFYSPAPRCMSGEALVGMPWRQPCCRRHGQPAHGRSGDKQPADEPDQSTKQVASHRVNVDFSSS
jgi:hypothetical protein